MLNPSNGLSFLRAPLALFFLIDNPISRTIVILLAMLSDCIDGYLARKFRYTSRFGAILDPIMDKFFVFFALGVLLFEKKVGSWQTFSMLSRDGFLAIFGVYLALSKNWKAFKFQPIRWGKVTTAAQFCILILLSLNVTIPTPVFIAFIVIGGLAFVELLQLTPKAPS